MTGPEPKTSNSSRLKWTTLRQRRLPRRRPLPLADADAKTATKAAIEALKSQENSAPPRAAEDAYTAAAAYCDAEAACYDAEAAYEKALTTTNDPTGKSDRRPQTY